MLAKRIAILCSSLVLLGTATVYADSMWGNYNGFEKARVYVNDTELQTPSGGVPAIVMNGSTLLPLRQLTNSLQATVKWDNDTKTAYIYKPNVHMFIAEEVGKNYSLKNPFGRVEYGKTRSFDVFVQVDNLKAGASGIKVTIEDPHGTEVGRVEDSLSNTSETFWYTAPFKVKFSESGNYTVKFAFVNGDSSDVVAQKNILSE